MIGVLEAAHINAQFGNHHLSGLLINPRDLIKAFNEIAGADAMGKASQLASGIALALCVVGVCAGGRRRGDSRTGVGIGRAALGLSSAVCVGWRLIEFRALLFLVGEVDHRLARSTVWRGLERGCTRG